MKEQRKRVSFDEKLTEYVWLRAIRDGMILAIPIILVGCVCSLLSNFPVKLFPFLEPVFKNEIVLQILQVMLNSTMNVISLVLVVTISYSYGKIKHFDNLVMLPIVTLCTYIMVSLDIDNLDTMTIFHNEWQLNAILFSITCAVLFVYFSNIFRNRKKRFLGSSNPLFNSTMQSVFPTFMVVIIFLGLKILLLLLFGVSNIQTIITDNLIRLFDGTKNTLFTALLFVFLKQVLWFFGVHGSYALDYTYYAQIYSGSIGDGKLTDAMQIFSEPFFSNFVFLGGCGTLLCMCIAILLFTKNKRNHMKQISKFAALPLVFNMNELLLFGLPVVLNPVLLIPFILVPCVITCTTYAAMYLGIVPVVSGQIGWTVPILISGYLGTGSVSGILLQISNLLLGILIYKPFVLRYEKNLSKVKKRNVHLLEEHIRQCEEKGIKPKIEEFEMAEILKKELEVALEEKKIQMFYQPQVDKAGKMLGAEALLRWNLEEVGYLYPPLVIALAGEAGLTQKLNQYIINLVCSDVQAVNNLEEGLEFSFNISAEQLSTPYIVDDIRRITQKYQYGKHNLGLEITEQTALQSSTEVTQRISQIRDMGIHIIMDDFGMGHSSLVYLKDNEFDLVKIDGSLVKNLTENDRCADIISSIMKLSDSLGFDVLAEYVETKEQQKNLENLNCNHYQGYLFSKPVPFEELTSFIKKQKEENNQTNDSPN